MHCKYVEPPYVKILSGTFTLYPVSLTIRAGRGLLAPYCLAGSFEGPHFTFLCDVVGSSRDGLGAAHITASCLWQHCSLQSMACSRHISAMPEYTRMSLCSTLPVVLSKRAHDGQMAKAGLNDLRGSFCSASCCRHSCRKAVPERGVLQLQGCSLQLADFFGNQRQLNTQF